ncbi:uncharacterized protein LOC114324584 [Diabrotica virgifera virgifera]|uniref:Uncharacterized protein LOC114324584 n=1 Tax=Diabrotica virgifera virgifera TaxID=50390 RepID=A0A6P7EZ30_DIAVI|nr:uncharacterized protein LOC114324584 [Diabrotica virgifera virgifera]
MNNINYSIVLLSTLVIFARCDQSAVDVIQDIYSSCLKDFSVSCVQPKSLQWLDNVSGSSFIKITDDLAIQRKYDAETETTKGLQKDVLDQFEDFLQSHNIVARAPAILKPNGPLGQYIPRSFQPADLTVPLAATGRSSKLVKRIIFPFLLGLKFKTAVLVPFALALIALKTWKALTLGLLSLVLSGAIAIFSKLMGPKTQAYEVVHVPQHLDHHVGYHHHVDVLPAPAVPVAQPVYLARSLNAQDLAYSAHRQ